MTETIEQAVARRRTFAIIAHPDAGKTTLTEKLLLFGGAIQLAGEVKAKKDRMPDALRLDEDRARARHLRRHLGDDLRIWRQRLQPARHARPRGFRRRHLPHAVGGRFRRHGHRRRQGHRAAHAEAVRGLPPARHPDRHLRQQDGPREPRPVRDPRRDRAEAGARHRADHLADRPGQDLLPAPIIWPRTRCAAATTEIERTKVNGPDSNRVAGLLPENEREAFIEELELAREACRPVRPGGLPRGPSDAGLFRLGAAQFRRARPDRGARRLRAAAARPGGRQPHGRGDRAEDDRLRLQDPGQHGPQPPRPHRLRPRLLRQAGARHEGQAGAHRQADEPVGAAVLLRPQRASPPTRPLPATSSAFPTTARCASATR